MRLRVWLGSLLATVLVVPTSVVWPTAAVGRDAPHPIAPQTTHLAIAGVDAEALASEPVPPQLAHRLAERPGVSRGADARRSATPPPAVLTRRLPTPAFTTVGVTWVRATAPADLVVSLRTRSDGVWSGWQDAPVLHDTASGAELAATTREVTAPLWVGRSDGVQVRVDVLSGRLPDGLRVDLVDPGTSAADDDVAAAARSTSSAAAGRLDIVTRAEWGADESLRDRHLESSRTIKAAFVHHTAGSNDYSPEEAPAVIRGLLAYVTGSAGYADIPYNFLVDKYGTVYEGRAGSVTRPVRQAATGGFNADTMSVVAMGNFVRKGAPDVMVEGIAKVLAYRLSRYHRNPFGTKVLVAEDGSPRYAPGQRAKLKLISGHGDAGITACPGKKLYDRLPEIRQQVSDLIGTGFIEPRRSPTSVSYGAADRVDVTARALTPMEWTLSVRRQCDDAPIRTITGQAAPGEPLDVVWRGRDDAGASVGAGRFILTLTGTGADGRAVGWQRVVQLQVGSPGRAPRRSSLAPVPGGRYVPVGPNRLAATSTGFGLDAPLLLAPSSRLQVPVLGRAGVPESGVTAVALNVLASCASRSTTVAVGPSGVPAASGRAVSVDAGTTARGLAVSGVGSDGAVTVTNQSGTVAVVLSVTGYWTTSGAGDAFVPVARSALPGTRRGLAVGTRPVHLTVAGRAGVPAGAEAVVLNLRRGTTGTAGSVWAWPSGRPRPEVAWLRRDAGQASSQRAIVPLGKNGAIAVAADGSSRVVLDVVGYLGATGSSLRPVAPQLLTSASLRLGSGGKARVPVAGVAGVPSKARSVVLQLSGSDASGATRLYVFPRGEQQPRRPDLVVPKGRDRTNLVLVPVGGRGQVTVAARGRGVGVGLTVVGWMR